MEGGGQSEGGNGVKGGMSQLIREGIGLVLVGEFLGRVLY